MKNLDKKSIKVRTNMKIKNGDKIIRLVRHDREQLLFAIDRGWKIR